MTETLNKMNETNHPHQNHHLNQVVVGKNQDDEDDKDTVEEINQDRKKMYSASRRFSVFSKSYDPEASPSSEVDNNNNNNNNDSSTSSSLIVEKIDSLNLNNNNNNNCTNTSSSSTNNNDNNGNINNGKDVELYQNKPYEETTTTRLKSSEQVELLRGVLRSIVLFQHLYEEDLMKIIESMFERKCAPGEVVIREGDNGHYFYLISSGSFEIFIKNSKVGGYNDKGFFGELALMYNQQRSATVVSRTESVLYCMNRDTFQRLVIQSSFKRRKMYEDFLASVPLLKESMNDCERSQVADALTSRTYAPGECIFKQHDEPNGMYFIESGCVRISQEESKQIITKLGVGEYFGELALVNKSGRSASAYADEDAGEPCKLAFLDLNAFERLMGPCFDLLKSRISSYTTR